MARKRWSAKVFYNSELGEVEVEHDFEELDELADLIERGPSWDTISRVEIDLVRPGFRKMTIEEAAKL